MEEQEHKINMSINEGEAFFAHQASINFNPHMFFLDFKSITPRIDERSQAQPTIVLKHNLVMIEPYHAVLFRNLLDRVVKDYEKEFGKIDKPKAIKIIEARNKKGNAPLMAKPDSSDKTETGMPSYFG